MLLTHPSSVVSFGRFRLMISKQKFRCKSPGKEVEKELFRTQSGIQTKYGGV